MSATPLEFETHPDRYQHWRLRVEGEIATLELSVSEDGGVRPGYALKLNSYDLGVDIELADAIQRIRFEHPAVRAVIVTSALGRMFCAGANIPMLGSSDHGFKVNFCKFTNETRLAMEDASARSGIRFLAALNGAATGGGYELALACDEIALVDDRASVVSLPEVPLLAVLPGTGGLTRLTDKRRVRRDLADAFCSSPDGVRGVRAVEWGLVDVVYPPSRFDEEVRAHAERLAASSPRRAVGAGVVLEPLAPQGSPEHRIYRFVDVFFNAARRIAEITVQGPPPGEPGDADELRTRGAAAWCLRVWRELDDAILHLRVNRPELGCLVFRSEGDAGAVLGSDALLIQATDDWLASEILHHATRVLKRLDATARSWIALIEPGSCFAGSLAELAIGADRSYALDDPERDNPIWLGPLNAGALPMANGLSRLASRLGRDADRAPELCARGASYTPLEAREAGLVTFAPDDLDWDDEVRLALEERMAISPDALTGLEANLRFAGPETLETKIMGRLSAWQNWIFQRPNATGSKGALTLYGTHQRPDFDLERT